MNSNPKIMLLTDQVIGQYSEDNIITTYKDIDLKILNCVKPFQGGVYDQDIFGSMFSDRCNCGNIRTPGVRCPRCGSILLDEEQSFKRFARIELPLYYSSKFKIDKIIKLLSSNFNIVTNFRLPQFDGHSWNENIILDSLQWTWNEKEEKLVISDTVTDFTKCSWEGLIHIFKTYFPDMLQEYMSYINRYILVIPMALRAPKIKMDGNNRILENHITTVVYQNILYCCSYYLNTFPTMKEELLKSLFRGALRKLISSSISTLSQLFNSSKQNLARSMQSNRLMNSGRCTIVPDSNLKGDEIVIPIHLMYEACSEEFIQYLMDQKNVSRKEAEMIYKTQSDLDEIQDLFKKYIEGDPSKPDTAKYVIINRAPSLYAYSMFSCKVKLTYDYTMKIPQVLCKPTNADFDGDTVSFYAVPKKMNIDVNQALGAQNRIRYQKNFAPLYVPTQEIMQGLILATKVLSARNPEMKIFDDVADAEEYRKSNTAFKYQSICMIGGEQTTLGRAKLSELFGKNINTYLGSFDKCLTAKTVPVLYDQLEGPDRLTRIRDIQVFACYIATLSGSTSVSLSDLYLDIDQSYLDRMKKIENDPKIEERSKELKIREIYREYQEVELAKIPEGVKASINDSVRAKVTELRDMAVQQLNVGPDHEYSVAETSLVSGLSPNDYAFHALENRATQDIKQLFVPSSGYVTRQFTYLASEYYYKNALDPENDGIELTSSDLIGRTAIDGTILTKTDASKNHSMKVRSIITSHQPQGMITKDMISNLLEYKDGSKIGMSMISALTESLTQGGLALKHGGNLYNFNPEDSIETPEAGLLNVTDDRITFTGDSGHIYIWPKNPGFTTNYNGRLDGRYEANDLLGSDYHAVTPSYTLDSIIKLCSARTVNGQKHFSNNQKIVAECYAIEDGIIKYTFSEAEGTRVFIGDTEYTYSPNSLYFFPSGKAVHKYDRICTGTLDMRSMVSKVTDYVELFSYFKKQFDELMKVSSEMIEFLYVLLIKKSDGYLEMKSVLQNIHGSDSFFKSLAFGDARKSFQKVEYEGLNFVADPITSVILPLIMSNEIS